MCKKWFAKFCTGDFCLKDTPQPVMVDNDQSNILLENVQSYMTREIKSNVEHNLHTLNRFHVLLPHKLSERSHWTVSGRS